MICLFRRKIVSKKMILAFFVFSGGESNINRKMISFDKKCLVNFEK